MKSLSVKLGVFLVIGFALFFINVKVRGAECAWVLWKKYERIDPDRTVEWEVVSAVPQYEECLRLQKRVLRRDKESHKRNFKESVDISDWIITIKLEKGLGMISHECLPDTIDPRK